jgi:hypothetical protein
VQSENINLADLLWLLQYGAATYIRKSDLSMVRSTITLAFCLSILVLSLPSPAQQNAAAGQAPSAEKLPSDLRIPAVLKVTLSSKKSKVGDPVKLEVSADVRDQSGTVVIPRHTKLTGRVTQAVPYQKNKQRAMLSFVVERAEWKDHSAVLDAPVYGTDVLATNSRRGEIVGGIEAATLDVDDPVEIVNTEIMSDTRSGSVGSGYAHAVRDAAIHTVVMQLTRVPNPAIRTAFVKKDGDLQVPSESMFVFLNGMKAAQ